MENGKLKVIRTFVASGNRNSFSVSLHTEPVRAPSPVSSFPVPVNNSVKKSNKNFTPIINYGAKLDEMSEKSGLFSKDL
jgi:hypothetical protein